MFVHFRIYKDAISVALPVNQEKICSLPPFNITNYSIYSCKALKLSFPSIGLQSPPPFSMPVKLSVILYGEAKSYCIIVGSVPEIMSYYLLYKSHIDFFMESADVRYLHTSLFLQNERARLCSLVRYCSCHSNTKFISSRHRVISSISSSLTVIPFVLTCTE